MTNQLEGRELDRAVAVALGWHSFGVENVKEKQSITGDLIPAHEWHYGASPGAAPGSRMHIPRFSTEFSHHTQEMLDWLRVRGFTHVGMHQWSRSGASASCYIAAERPQDECPSEVNDCGAIPEAIARLVVAVAEAEGGGDVDV